ncbi:uncharacterized protein LOC113300150 [Papaver somniferum]|uniref:uncharacterized protein LOC113300150 n=1 Tax=Papaver somniferum TaxID=3469 RepID=UPI000E6F6C94|nr:uncharacterized protein LOC113300150 [Papaver somniferum]
MIKKGNIRLFWSALITEHTVVSITNQVATVNVGGVLVSGIHAASLAADRKELWLELEQVNSMDLPWLLIGDFNTVLSVDEKNGGRTPLRVAMQDFHEALNVCNLIRAPSSGLQFTWSNNRAGSNRIVCTLDRSLFNLKWIGKYSGWNYKIEVRSISVHSPLLGSCVNIPKPKNVPFRVLKIWLEHEDFKSLIKEIWDEEVRGNPIQATNAITELEDANGTIITDQHQIAHFLEQYFEEKFKFKNVAFVDGVFDVIPEVVTSDDNNMLEGIYSSQEIKDVVFSLNADSSPRPDGFPGFFYRFAWEIIGEDLIKAIQYCWGKGVIPR